MMPFAIGSGILYVKKSGIKFVFSHNYARIKIVSYDSLPLEKTLILYNVVVLVNKSVFNKDQNRYYYSIFLGKCSYQLAFFDTIIMLRFVETKVAKKEFYSAKNQ